MYGHPKLYVIIIYRKIQLPSIDYDEFNQVENTVSHCNIRAFIKNIFDAVLLCRGSRIFNNLQNNTSTLSTYLHSVYMDYIKRIYFI